MFAMYQLHDFATSSKLEVKDEIMAQSQAKQLPKQLTVGEVARRSGVAVSTLHFYEAKGLIRSLRSEGNQRRYPRGMLRRIAIIRVAQRTGMPLVAIRAALAAIPADRQVTAADWARL